MSQGRTMFDRWVGKKVNLKSLSENLVQFFEEKGFSSVLETESSNEYRVIAVPKQPSNIQGSVNVFIRGNSEDFVVEFVGDSSPRLLRVLGGLSTLFGGGILVLKDLKSQEELERLEREFWSFLDRKIESWLAVDSGE